MQLKRSRARSSEKAERVFSFGLAYLTGRGDLFRLAAPANLAKQLKRRLKMIYLIHDAPGYKLEAAFTSNPITGLTLELHSTWPTANHPEPHRLLSLTLPPDSFARLAESIAQEARQENAIQQLEKRLNATVDRSDPMLGAMAGIEMALMAKADSCDSRYRR